MAKKVQKSARSNKKSKKQVVKGSGGLRSINFFGKKLLVVLILLIAVVGGFWVFKSQAATPQGTYTNWSWSAPAEGYNSFEHNLLIEKVTPDSTYFWSHQFQMVGGDGGYIGLQSHGSRVNGTVGKTAIFSIFSSGIAGTAGSCIVQQAGFDGYNTSGTSCRVPFEWVEGRTYKLRVAYMSSDSTGKRWGGWVTDTSTGVETFIAQIKVPTTWKGLGAWSVMWTEYFGVQPATCDQLPYSRVRFYTPKANGSIVPASMSNFLSTSSTCTNSAITNFTGGTIQEMGNSLYQAPAPTPVVTTDTTAPIVKIAQPANGSKVVNPVLINASASDNVGVVQMQVYADGKLIKTTTDPTTASSISASWTAPKSKGKQAKKHTIKVIGFDKAGNQGSQSVTVYY